MRRWTVRIADLAGPGSAADLLDRAPVAVAARLLRIAQAAADAGPLALGGGYVEAMHGDMAGWFEIRCTGPGREQYRLFALLEATPAGSAIVLIAGLRKPHRSRFAPADYARVRRLGDLHRCRQGERGRPPPER